MNAPTRTLLLCALAAGCNGDIQAVTWAPLDIEQLEDDLENPTSPLTAATLAELQSTPADEIVLIKGLLQAGRLLLDTSGEGEMEAVTRDLDVNLSGTQVYVRIACPGPIGMVADPDFRYGTLTIYTAGLSEATLDTWGAQGDMLGILDECLVGEYALDGRMRMYYDTIRDLLAMDFDIDWERGATADHLAVPAILERDALTAADARARVLFTVDAGTLVLEQRDDIGPTEYVIRGSDREILCDNLDEPDCPPL